MTKRVSEEYLEGIREGRAALRKVQSGADSCYLPSEVAQFARDELDNLTRTARTFDASSPVGQMLRGERDFWRGQIKRGFAA